MLPYMPSAEMSARQTVRPVHNLRSGCARQVRPDGRHVRWSVNPGAPDARACVPVRGLAHPSLEVMDSKWLPPVRVCQLIDQSYTRRKLIVPVFGGNEFSLSP